MSATLKIINNFSMELMGVTYSGKQGAAADNPTDTQDITVNGQIHAVSSQLASGAVATVWDDDDDFPTGFQYLFYWADKNTYLQVIGATSNFIVPVLALTPFVLAGYDTMLAAVNTTKMTIEPTLESVDNITIGNFSGNTANYVFGVVN